MISRHKLIAVTMITLGLLLAVIGYLSGGKWSLIKDETGIHVPTKQSLVNNSYTLEAFTSIDVFTDYGDVEILSGDSYVLEVNAIEDEDVRYSVKNGTLTVETESKKKNRLSFGFSVNQTPSIKIYVPEKVALNKVVVDSNFGDTTLRGLHYQQLNVISNYGDIRFKHIDGINTEITQSFGDMTLEQFTSNGFVAESEHGDIDIDGTLNGQTTITSSFGDTTLNLQNKKSDLGYELNTDFGDITVDRQEQSSKISQLVKGNHQLSVSLSHGDLSLSLH
ncbi:DUF4097 family beta strand repeat-containing protein [Lysinibacillus sphaericus]|uniref:DUF4097 family beta strand repeat-containing protein n=1 Tax=Lysinibacillus sphaericus TaxID=1421 RepID=UPI003F78F5BA